MQVDVLGAFVAQDFFGPHWAGGWLCRSFEGWGFGVSDGASGDPKTSGVPPIYARKLQSLTDPKSSTPPVLCVISLALHGATAFNSEVAPRRCIVRACRAAAR